MKIYLNLTLKSLIKQRKSYNGLADHYMYICIEAIRVTVFWEHSVRLFIYILSVILHSRSEIQCNFPHFIHGCSGS